MSSLVSSRTWISAPPCTNGTCASHTTTVRIGMAGNARIVSRGVTEIDDVPVEHDVLLALETQLAVIATRGERPAREQVLVADDFGADEAALNVGVDLAGRALRVGPARDRPGAVFVFPDGEKRDVAEQVVARADHAIEP